MNLSSQTLKQTLTGLAQKQFSQSELVADLQATVTKDNPTLNAFLTMNDQQEKQAQQHATLPLKGIPIAVKDNYCTKGLRTTASSTVLDTFTPQFESTVTSKLQAAGGVIQGKTNLDAWAHGSSTETSQYGRTVNPRNTEYLPGGSSGGSAAAVAGNLAIAALGSETAGSIRQPSSWCGCVGLKPTYGRCSRFGVVAMGSSLDSPGPIAKTVEDAALLLTHIAGHDSHDATTTSQAVPDFTKSLGKSIKGVKIGVLYRDLAGLESVSPHLEAAAAELVKLGAQITYVKDSLDPHYAISVYTVVQRAEVSSNLARYDGVRYGTDRSVFGDEARRRIILGTFVLSNSVSETFPEQSYISANRVRALFAQDFARLFGEFDVLISLSTPGFAKKVGASEGAAMFGELEDMLQEPSSITGLPGVSVPCYRDPETNLFLGLNIMAPMWREDLVIQVGDAYERATHWNEWRNQA